MSFAAVALALSRAVFAASAPPPSVITKAAGPEYAAGAFHRLWFGAGYRELWTAPLTLPLLDLRTFAGGLEPVRQIGRLQTIGLALRGRDGRAYTFRALRREPERVLPAEWRRSWPARLVRDHTAMTHPGAALVVPVLAEALGLLHSNPRLVVLPDDAALGAFRERFAGEIGTIEEYPRAGIGAASFAGATEIVTTQQLWERWLASPRERVDARAFLRARVLDLLVEDYDRHEGQWRFVRLPGVAGWQPLAEDRDMAFIRNEGLAVAAIRGRAPKFVRFAPEFHRRLEGSTRNGASLDRWLLVGLDRAGFEAVAEEVRARLTDDVIAAAVAALPPEWRPASERVLVPALRARRERLRDHVLHYYADLARQVDVQATDRSDTVTLRGTAEGLELELASVGEEMPWLVRRFRADETDEVRIHLHGGDDRVRRSGPPGGPVRLHVVAGDGQDVIDDSSSGGTQAWSGPGALELKRGRGTERRGPARPTRAAPWLRPREDGRWTVPYSQVLYAPELDLVAGAGLTRRSWGFQTAPEARRQDLSALWSTGEQRGRVEYAGTFRRAGSPRAFHFDALYSGIERINFFGLGNESERPSDKLRFRTRESFLALAPALRHELSRRLRLELGASLRHSRSPEGRPNVLNETRAYGRGSFSEAGLRAGARYDSRGLDPAPSGLFANPSPERRLGLQLGVTALVVPALLDVERSFGGVEGEAAAQLGRADERFQLCARLGGRRMWGRYPWFESAFVGGRLSLRGYSRNRFAGDASGYGGLEGRAWLFSADVPPIPLRLGVLAFVDTGRVWLEGERSREWHSSWGGGLVLQPLATPFVLSATAARSPEDTRFYFGYGFFF